MLNCYEGTVIKKRDLPEEWQSSSALDEMNRFLQINWEQRYVIYYDANDERRQQFLFFMGHNEIKIGRYIGTIIFKGQQLNIFPKVFKSEKSDFSTQNLELSHLIKNLLQWIKVCNKTDYPFINIKSGYEDSNDLKELFITLYIQYVINTIDRSLFYQYEDQCEDCVSIKGKFDCRDYICNKIPSGNAVKFLCSYSSFEVDNRINQIIKYTCKLLANEITGKSKKLLRRILVKLNEVSDVKCTPADCDKIRLSRLQSNYHVIVSMSKMFLLNKSLSYEFDKNDSFCFLFPMDYLFEGFIGGHMKDILSDFAEVNLQESKLSLVENIVIGEKHYNKSAFTMRHDILVKHNEKGLYVFDTKYKEISRLKNNDDDAYQCLLEEAKQPDLYQMFTYAIKRNLMDIYLLYPMYRFEYDEDVSAVMVIPFTIDGIEYKLSIHVVRLPFVFEDDIELTKSRLTSTILRIFD